MEKVVLCFEHCQGWPKLIAIVARVVNYIKKHLVGKTLAVVKAEHDENVFGKVGTSAAAVEKALTGKKVLDAKQQGKYFWYVAYCFSNFFTFWHGVLLVLIVSLIFRVVINATHLLVGSENYTT